MVFTLTSAVPAFADTQGNTPNFGMDCGAYRDIPSDWTPHSGGYCSSQGWGYSYVFTSPSIHHYATWDFDLEQLSGATTYYVEAWIPSYGAGQHTAYYYQLCGSSNWTYVGQLFQESDSGWYTPGSFTLSASQTMCAVREENTGNQSWDMAEDALGIYLPVS